jgi:hypothetical protein
VAGGPADPEAEERACEAAQSTRHDPLAVTAPRVSSEIAAGQDATPAAPLLYVAEISGD